MQNINCSQRTQKSSKLTFSKKRKNKDKRVEIETEQTVKQAAKVSHKIIIMIIQKKKTARSIVLKCGALLQLPEHERTPFPVRVPHLLR